MTLEKKFIEFVRTLKSAENVDELDLNLEQKKAKKPDFFFCERQFIGEMKTITEDMEPKALEILAEHKNRTEYPVFYSQWQIDKVLKHLPDGEDINQKILNSITSAIEKYVKVANRQIRTTKEVFKLDDSQGILIVLNDLVNVLPPDIIAYKIHQLFNKKYPSKEPRFPFISTAWIISELHVLRTDLGQKLLPSIVVTNDCSPNYKEAENYVIWLQRKWASFNNIPFVEGNFDIAENKFSKREEPNSPEMIPRSEMWRKQYLKNSYLRHLSEEQLLEHGQRLYSKILPGFITGSHEKPPQEKVFELMEPFTHFLEEVDYRGIDFRKFAPNLHEAVDELKQDGKLKMQDQYVDEGDQTNDPARAD